MSEYMYYTPSTSVTKPKFRIPRTDMLEIQDQIEYIAHSRFLALQDRDILLKRVKSRDFMWHMLAQCPWLEDEDEVQAREEGTTQYQRFVDLTELVHEWELYLADRKLWQARNKGQLDKETVAKLGYSRIGRNNI
jgi:hypothetical protein